MTVLKVTLQAATQGRSLPSMTALLDNRIRSNKELAASPCVKACSRSQQMN